MLKALRIIVGLVCASPLASGAEMHITCEQTSNNRPPISSLYKDIPKSTDEMMTHFWDAGVISLVGPRAKSWTIDLEKRLMQPSGGEIAFTVTETSAASIYAIRTLGSGINETIRMNRIEGKLTYSAYLREKIVRDWKEKHGGDMQQTFLWELNCTQVTPKL